MNSLYRELRTLECLKNKHLSGVKRVVFKSFLLFTAIVISSPPVWAKELVPSANLENNQANHQEAHKAIVNELKNYRAFLENGIFGQPEIINSLVALRSQQLYFGQSSETTLIGLMGLPGTGKDTTAETDVDALNGKVGAHIDHLYRVPIIRQDYDLAKLVGSAPGLLSSEQIPPIIQFVVLHSGGEYMISGNAVTRNEKWKPGEILPGYFSPDKAGIFINELHDWSRVGLNGFFKEFAEKGMLTIANAKGGLDRIIWRGKTYLASNDLVQLYSSLMPDGKAFGPSLSFEEITKLWEGVQREPHKIMDGLRSATESGPNGQDPQPRFSPEVLNRLKPSTTFLMKPLSPENLRKLIELKIGRFFKRIENAPREYPQIAEALKNIKFQVSPHVYQFIQEYDYKPEAMGRPLVERISSFFETTLAKAFSEGHIELDGNVKKLNLDIKKNADRSASLVIEEFSSAGTLVKTASVVIPSTMGKVPQVPLSDREIEELVAKRKALGEYVFGADEALDRVAKAMLKMKSVERSDATDAESANILVFAGLTSTGKSETVKAIGRVYFDNPDAAFTEDFSNIRSESQLEEALASIGRALDRGKKIIFLDEVINSDPRFLLRLYPLLREKRAALPGGPQNMKGVLVILAGNMGSKWFSRIPGNIPTYQKITAQEKVFKAGINDPELVQRTLLESGFTPALIARLAGSVIFFDPHGYKSIRQLTQNKLKAALNDLKPRPGVRGWNIEFASQDDALKTIESLEREGYDADKQGASLDNYISKYGFKDHLFQLLMENKIPNGEKVILKYVTKASQSRGSHIYDVSQFTVQTASRELKFETYGRIQEHYPSDRIEDEFITAYHEAAHSLISQALFGKDRRKQVRISTIPGVDDLGGEFMTYYLGIAENKIVQNTPVTRGALIADMAVLLGGEVAQTLVTRGALHDAGKGNDIERASLIGQLGILKWGLSEAWGHAAIPVGQSVAEYLNGLTSDRKKILEDETAKLFQEARTLARAVLLANYDTSFIPLGKELIRVRDMGEPELNQFYSSHTVIHPNDVSWLTSLKSMSWASLTGRFSKYLKSKDTISADLLPTIAPPAEVGTLEKFIMAARKNIVDKVPIDPGIPVAKAQAVDRGVEKPTCSAILKDIIPGQH